MSPSAHASTSTVRIILPGRSRPATSTVSEVDGAAVEIVPDATDAVQTQVPGLTASHGLLDTIYDGLIVSSCAGRIVEVNDRAAALFHRPAADLVRLRIPDIIDGADDQLLAELAGMAGQQPFAVLDAYGIRGDGSEFAAEIVVHPMPTDEGARLVLFVRDISRRIQMEKELLRLSQAVASTSDGVAITDEEGHHIYQNEAFLRLVGSGQAATLASRKGFAWLLGSVSEPLQRTLAAVYSWSGRADIRNDQGQVVPTLFRVDPIRHDNGRVIGSVAIVTDITKEQQAAEKLRQTLSELERSNAELEQIAYVASHDLKEPLRVIAGYLDLLQRRYGNQLDETARGFMKHAVDGALRMRALINHLLDYARLNRSPGPLATISASHLVRQAMDNLRSLLDERHAQVLVDPLPEIRTAPLRMVQVFQNLIDNAVRYCDKDIPRVQVRAVRREAHWVFLVSDNGPGIPEELQERVFILFQRLHTQEERQGSGIGLATCKKITERFGGRMWIEESTPGRGTTFAFSAPLAGLTAEEPLP